MVLFTIETNNTCRFFRVCKGCVLGERESVIGTQCLLSEDMLAQASREAISSRAVKNFVYAGREPLETPDIIFENTEYAKSLSKRPRVGIITNGILLQNLVARFEKNPIDELTVSLDVESGLHDSRLNDSLLADVLKLRAARGAAALGVNTVFTGSNTEEVVELGKKLCKAEIDQWTVAPFSIVSNNMKRSSVTADHVRELILRFIEEFGQVTKTTIVVHVAPELFVDLMRDSVTPLDWRYAAAIEGMKNGFLNTVNMSPGHFIRLTYFGELFDMEDMQNYGTREGKYGSYVPGRLRHALRTMARERSGSKIINNKHSE